MGIRTHFGLGVALALAASSGARLQANPVLNSAVFTDRTLFSIGSVSGIDSIYSYSAVAFRTDIDRAMLATYNPFASDQVVYSLTLQRAAGHIVSVSLDSANNVTAHTGVGGVQITGGMTYAPDGALLFTLGPDSNGSILGQIKGLSERYDSLTGVSLWGGLGYVPAGFPGAGKLRATSFDSRNWYDVTVGLPSPVSSLVAATANNPWAFAWLPATFSSGMTADSILVADRSTQAEALRLYDIDPVTGNPAGAGAVLVSTGGSEVVGVARDPVTGDILFTTYTADTRASQLWLIRTEVPEPSTLLLAGAAFSLLALRPRHRRATAPSK